MDDELRTLIEEQRHDDRDFQEPEWFTIPFTDEMEAMTRSGGTLRRHPIRDSYKECAIHGRAHMRINHGSLSCGECHRITARAYSKNNPEKRAEQNKRYYEKVKHTEQYKARVREASRRYRAKKKAEKEAQDGR